MQRREPANPLVMGHERAAQLDGRCEQQPVSRVQMLEIAQVVGLDARTPQEGHHVETGLAQASGDPFAGWAVEVYPAAFCEHRDFPGGDGADQDRAACAVMQDYQLTGCRPQPVVTAVEPKQDMGVEKDCVLQGAKPLSASMASYEMGAVRSMPSRTMTEPSWAPNKEPDRAAFLQAALRQDDSLGFVSSCGTLCDRFDQRDHVWPLDRDHASHMRRFIIEGVTIAWRATRGRGTKGEPGERLAGPRSIEAP